MIGKKEVDCGICWQEFEAADAVVDCAVGHVFHASCFEEEVTPEVQLTN